MKFQNIRIDAFGALSQCTLNDLDSGLCVVYGPNGSGKTTLLQFLRGVFCGFTPARRLRLIPPANGQPAGGTITAFWDGDACEFRRAGESDVDQKLDISRIHEQRPTSSLSPSANRLPLDQIPLLFTVERGDVHAFDGLVRMAQQDGIQLAGMENDAERRNALADAEARRAKLIEEARGHLTSLEKQRNQLRAERRSIESERESQRRRAAAERAAELARLQAAHRRRVEWLHGEVQAAESDLREAEERVWDRHQSSDSPIPLRLIPRPRLRRFPSTSHVDVKHREELEAIDRRIDAARNRLADIARARLEVSLRAARIAGSPDIPTETFLNELRTSLSVMEDSLLELRETGDGTGDRSAIKENRHLPRHASPRAIVDEVFRRLYGTCDQVSQFEIQHLQQQLNAEMARLDEEEQSECETLQSLRLQWAQLAERTGLKTAWPGTCQHAADRQFCQCSEHDEESRTTDDAPVASVANLTRWSPRPTIPSSQEIARLRNRRRQLVADLDQARCARRDVEQPAFELSEDVHRFTQELDRKQRELDAVERELSVAQEQWRVLSQQGGDSSSERQEDNRPPCLQWAAEYLTRLTAGRYVDLRITSDRFELFTIDQHGEECPRWGLSRGTLDQVALCLRLALVREYAARGVRFPLVLDDVLVDCDVERLHEAVRLLKEFAEEHNQQIVYLTCGTHLVSLFAAEHAAVRSMPGSKVVLPENEPPTSPPSRWSVQGWIDRRSRKRRAGSTASESQPRAAEASSDLEIGAERSAPAHDEISSTEASPALSPSTSDAGHDTTVLPLRRRQPGGPYWVSLDSPVILVPSVGEQMSRRLVALGIGVVEDLLGLSAEDLSIPLKALQVDAARLREWQAEANLLVCVPDLAGPDAQLLVACGVRDAHQLAESDVAQLVQRLDRFARRNRDDHIRSSQPTNEDLSRWIHSARRSRSLNEARRDRPQRQRVRRIRMDQPHVLREIQHTEPVESAPIVPLGISTAAAALEQDKSNHRQFYLNPDSPVVDAPSIGPRMASRLEKLGIVTVGDLIARDAAHVAERLQYRRVTRETVTAWQQQARLVCRIPQMRGHDAQVLVACDITEPEQVTRMDARTLYSIVEPFVSTKEGQRLLRSSKTPDLEEVADWIDWANHARPLRAA